MAGIVCVCLGMGRRTKSRAHSGLSDCSLVTLLISVSIFGVYCSYCRHWQIAKSSRT